ncbi:hypothetical protein RvY_10074-2 [Ramazzottius varieornatus]|uniref:Ig-like domain-containing protein n=1 Tax=Ramazzottius varieornatus TaxID=947166 RepID=A0A1D1VG22_RAMVA|nr:hypothetical protein RvY_10074-2 [Ramazzottius varieornatus]
MTKVAGISKSSYIVHPAYCEVVAEKSASEYHWAYIPLNSNHSWSLLPYTTPSINVSADESGTYQCSGRLDIGWSRWSAPVLITPSSTAALISASGRPGKNLWTIPTFCFTILLIGIFF